MRQDKKQAFDMRRKGKSYKDIYVSLKIPKSTLSGWFADVDWSSNVKRGLAEKSNINSRVRMLELNRVRGKNLERAYKTALTEAREEFEHLKYNPLFISGLMLYWGEGDKVTKYATRFINTDPDMVRLYVFFLQKACKVPTKKIRASLLIYPDLDNDKCLKFWSKISGIALEQFIKSSVIQGRHQTKRVGHGMCTVYVSSTYFKVKMNEWISLMAKELMSRKYYESIQHPRV
jgi:hypothetical protein